MTAASSTLLPIVLYLALSFVVALWAGKLSRKHENASGFLEEYFLGSRSMGGFVLAMKGTAAREELAEAKNAVSCLGLQVEKIQEFPMGDTSHGVIVLKKVKPTPPQYPRRYAKIKQSPL